MLHDSKSNITRINEYKKSDLEKLYNSAIKFLVPLSSRETYHIIIKQVNSLFNTHFGSIYLKAKGGLEEVYVSSPKIQNIKIRKTGYTYRSYREGKPSVISVGQVIKFHPQLRDMGIKSTVFIPLVYKKTKVGVISCDSFEVLRFNKQQLHVLSLFGALAMLAIRKSQLNDELAESLRTRDLFISMASHELRSPLTTINSYVGLIEKSIDKGKDIQPKWSKTLSLETKRLVHMVDELLQLDTIKSGRLQYNWIPTNLDDILLRAVVNFRVKFPGRKLVYKNKLSAGKGNVMADPSKLLQAVVNVLNNSGKFSEEDINMELYYKIPYFYITVEDRGIGISEGEISRVFEGFYKGDNSSKSGIGLGLYLAKSIIEMHRGKVQIESKKGIGTKVVFLLPRLVYGN